jgi:hypothetical protein
MSETKAAEVKLTMAERAKLIGLYRKRDKALREYTDAIVRYGEELVDIHNPPFYPVEFDIDNGVIKPKRMAQPPVAGGPK